MNRMLRVFSSAIALSLLVFTSAFGITLTTITTGFNGIIGIDHHAPTNQVIVSVNYPSGLPYNFELIASDGTRTQFSSISGLTDEIKIATAKDDGGGVSMGGFASGEFFTGSGVAGEVVRVSADGSTVQNPWVSLPGETGLMRGSLYVDRTGVFGGDLIVVTTAGNVWRISSAGAPTQLASLGVHLEGAVTVPNDPAKYGPWAGKIVTGAEGQGRIYSIDASGATAFYTLGINPEDFDIIPANENFFGVNYPNALLGAPPSEFAGMAGDIMITQEFGSSWRVYWDGAQFQTQLLATVSQWEHVTFSAAGILEVPPVDETPPTISCPDDILAPCSDADGAVVDFVVTAVDDEDPNPTVVCNPPSGSLFPIGITTVTCVATDALGNSAECSFDVTVAEGTGTVTGTLSADCAVAGITIDAFDSAGELAGFAVTDDAGSYSISDLPSGQSYTISFVAPLGYTAATSDHQVDIECNGVIVCDFSLECPTNTGEQRTIGFWKHQTGVATGGKGNAQISGAELCELLDLIASHFNGNLTNEVAIYVPPVSDLCEDKLEAAKDLLNLKGNVSMTARAKQQLMALLLNVASGKLAQTAVISDDGATVSQAITYCDNLVDDAGGDHEKAKTIADEINNNRSVAAGMIPLSTAQIAYKNAPLPRQFALLQNYPNPFNAGTVINYGLVESGHVTLAVYNVLGQRVVTLVDSDQATGEHSVSWNGQDASGRDVVSGLYLYRIQVGSESVTRKMTLLK